MTDDIWDISGPVIGGESDEGWDSGDSDSESPPARRAKRKRAAPARQTYVADDDDDPLIQPSSVRDDDDDLIDEYMQKAQNARKQQQQQTRSSKSPDLLIIDSDSDGGAAGQTKATAKAKESAAAVIVDTAVLSDAARAAAERTRRQIEQLEQARRAGMEDLDDEIEEELPPPAKAPRLVPAHQVEDLTLDEEDIDELLQLKHAPGSSTAPAAAAAAAQPGADEGKLPLKFQTEKKDDVTVLIRPTEPFAEALAKFREYVAREGWGTVSKFVFDGEKLTGEETADELGMEANDIIEVYLQ